MGSQNLTRVPLKALQPDTKHHICLKLNAKKILLSEEGLLRDYRGLAQKIGIPSDEIEAIDHLSNPCSQVLEQWPRQREPEISPTLANLLEILGQLDRWDVKDDTQPLMERDAEVYITSMSNPAVEFVAAENEALTEGDMWYRDQGLPLQLYDAMLLFAQEDVHKAKIILDILESRGAKVCEKDRDLMVGVFEHDAMLKLIADRCKHLVVIFSDAFFKTNMNRFLVSYAQSLGIDRDCRKVIPIQFEACTIPSNLNFSFRLKYTNSNVLYNFDDKLFRSVCPQASIPPSNQRSQSVVSPSPLQQTNQVAGAVSPSFICETPILPNVPDHDPMESGYMTNTTQELVFEEKKKKKKSRMKSLIPKILRKQKNDSSMQRVAVPM